MALELAHWQAMLLQPTAEAAEVMQGAFKTLLALERPWLFRVSLHRR
jgi:hypothetical protein